MVTVSRWSFFHQ